MSADQPTTTDRNCAHCGRVFPAKSWELRRGGGKYCTPLCYHASQAIPLETHFRRGVGRTTEGGCILWSGVTDVRGYGIIYSSTHRRGQRTFLAHRVAWELANGPIPDGLWALHRCDNPPCVNVDHLFIGTRHDNIDDMARKGRSPNRKLTDEQIRAVRARYASGGVSQQRLADEYGVHQTCISGIVRNRRWKYVTG